MKLICFLHVIFCATTALPQATNRFDYYGNLSPGKYKVGYTTYNVTDYSRSYHHWGRPLQLFVWYPSHANLSNHSMPYREYFNDIVKDWGTGEADVAFLKNMFEKDFRSGALNPSFSGPVNDHLFNQMLSMSVPVVRNAKHLNKRFPVLLHVASNGVLHQSLMLEYLASYGYVVISLSMYGSAPAFYGRGEDGVAGVAAMTDDLALALSFASTLTYADTSRIGVVGMMAQAGISLRMKEGPVDAVVCLDCHTDVKLLQALPYFDPRKVRLNIIQLLNSEFPVQNNFLLDSLVYSTRTSLSVKNLKHSDFYPFPKIARPDDSRRYRNHELVIESTRAYLDAVLKDSAAFKREDTGMSVKTITALEPMPSESEFLGWLRYGDIKKVKHNWDKYGAAVAGKENLFSVVLFLARDNAPNAGDAFKMYRAAYPDDKRLSMIEQFLKVDALIEHQEVDRMTQKDERAYRSSSER